MNSFRKVIILFALFIQTGLFAQNEELIDFQATRFHTLDINNGLAHTDAICFAQDTLGFIWIGTNNGIQRYDGKKLLGFTNNISSEYMPFFNRITALHSKGLKLWVGTERGLQLFNLSNLKYEALKVTGEKLNSKILSIYIDRGQNIWIASVQGLFIGKYNHAEKSIQISSISNIAHKYAKRNYTRSADKILGDNFGSIWVCDNHRLLRFTCDEIGRIIFNRIINDRSGIDIGDGNLDICQVGNRLFVLSRDKIAILDIEPKNGFVNEELIRKVYLDRLRIGDLTSKEKDNIRYNSIMVDDNRHVWLNTTYGLLQFDRLSATRGKGIFYLPSRTDPYAISESMLTSLFVDNSNTLWIGTFGGGANFLNLNANKFYAIQYIPEKPNISLNGAKIKDIDSDNEGRFWIATTTNGVSMFNSNTGELKHLTNQPKNTNSLISNEVHSIKTGPDNNIYIGTNQGIDIYNPNTNKFTHINRSNNKNNLLVRRQYGMDFDTLGQLWVGSWGDGINRIKFNKNGSAHIEQYKSGSTPHYLSSNYVNDVYVNKNINHVFLSTQNGIDRLILDDNGNISQIIRYKSSSKNSKSLSSNYVWPIAPVNDSVYWVGTLGGGLNKVTLTTQTDSDGLGIHYSKLYTTKEGLTSNDIEGLLIDGLGRVWISGKGLVCLDTVSNSMVSFDIYDGLQSNSFKVGADAVSNNGFFAFGGINGVTLFNPLEIKLNQHIPQVQFSGLKIGNLDIFAGDSIHSRVLLNKDISLTNKIKLKHTENDFSVEFASLQYSNPLRARYKYMLEGYDEDYIETNAENSVANYSNLKFGTYKLIVFGSNNNAQWNNDPISLDIQILPPWWFSLYAFIAYFILLIGIVYAISVVMTKMIGMKNNLKMQEQLHQMKLQFFTNISHEFRTPLTLILSPLQDLISGSVPMGSYPRLFNTMYKNTQRLLNLVNDLMDFRKAETGSMKFMAREVDVNNYVKEVTNQFKDISEKKNIDFTVNLSKVPIKIWADDDKLKTILFNLISNAFKYTNEPGSIEINIWDDAQNVHISKSLNTYFENAQKRTEKYMMIEIKDTGIGISRESLPKVFERFYQVDGENTHLHLGSGVGLALAKNLILMHGGDIGLSSERNKGTTFYVKFPYGISHLKPEQILTIDNIKEHSDHTLEERQLVITETAKTIETTVDLDSPVSKSARVLLVEDDDELRNYLVMKLNKEFIVFSTANGQQAVETAKKELPDVIVTDLMMPVMDGLEMTRLLKANPTTCHIPVIMLTAKSTVDDIIEGTEAGADIYLAKPVDVRLLNARIMGLITNRKRMLNKYSKDILFETRGLSVHENDKAFVDKLEAIIVERISDPDFDVNHICSSMNMGRTNLYQKVKKLTDSTLGDFIKNVRLKKAVDIMLSKNVSIAEVTYMVGMSSPSYFTKTFKKKFKKTPSEFLEECSRQK